MITTATFVKLQSLDKQEFKVDKKVAETSITIKSLLEDLEGMSEHPIPLPNVSGRILERVVEYCKHYCEVSERRPKVDQSLQTVEDEWDKEFLSKDDHPTLFELILAANYLDVKPLLDLCCKKVADILKGKTPEEIRSTFNIKNDFTPEEEEEVRKQNEWCEER